MQHNKKILLILIFSITAIGNSVMQSCTRSCPRVVDKFVEHESFGYYGFKFSVWKLNCDSLKCEINGGYIGAQGQLHRSVDKCKVISITPNYDVYIDSIIYSISTSFRYNRWTRKVKMSAWQSFRVIMPDRVQDTHINSNNNDIAFDINQTQQTSDYKVQMYFEPELTVNGKLYQDVMVHYFNVEDTLRHVRKLFIAPYVGPVRVEMSNNNVYDVVSSDMEMADAEFYK